MLRSCGIPVSLTPSISGTGGPSADDSGVSPLLAFANLDFLQNQNPHIDTMTRRVNKTTIGATSLMSTLLETCRPWVDDAGEELHTGIDVDDKRDVIDNWKLLVVSNVNTNDVGLGAVSATMVWLGVGEVVGGSGVTGVIVRGTMLVGVRVAGGLLGELTLFLGL